MSLNKTGSNMEGKVHRPSRKLFEQQCKQLADEIQVLQSKLAENKVTLNDLFAKLDKLRVERNEKFTEKSQVEGCVRAMSVNINKMSEKLAQLQSKLHYRDMKKLEDAIRTLQVHLDNHHFKHSEEKKIVAEIDKLSRSKKIVGEYLVTQTELRELRTNQHAKRADRDKLIKDIVTIRKQEEHTRGEINSHKQLETQYKTELEDYKDQKMALKEKFTEQQQTYAKQKESVKQAKLEARHKLEQTKQQQCIRTRCLGESASPACSQQTPEMICCQQLIEFCQRLTKQQGDERSNLRMKKKKISYTPDLLAQFMSINVCPPMTIIQADDCIPVLQDKLVHLKKSSYLTDNVDSSKQSSQIVSNINDCLDNDSEDENEDFCPYDDEGDEFDAVHPDDQSDKSLLSKQISTTSDEDSSVVATPSILDKLTILDSLCNLEDSKSVDSHLA